MGNIPCAREASQPEKDWHSSEDSGKIVIETMRKEECMTKNSSADSKMAEQSLNTEDFILRDNCIKTDQKFSTKIGSKQKDTGNKLDLELETEMKSAKTGEWVSEDKISDIEVTKVEKCGKSEIEKIESGADIGQAM